jgi:uridine phosphorylase
MAGAVVIEPCREKSEPVLPDSGLFLLNPAEIAHAQAASRGWQRRYLFHSNLYVAGPGDTFWCGPALGAPMAVICLEKLIALGARRVVACGWCGSLCQEIGVGDLVLPTCAVSEEGTSAHYRVPGMVASSPFLRQRLKGFFSSRVNVHEGPVWTTDALYRETREKVERFAAQGILAVDMEFSALAQVAAFRGVELAAVLLVSDLPWQNPWQAAFRGKKFREKSRQLVHDLFAFLETLPAD